MNNTTSFWINYSQNAPINDYEQTKYFTYSAGL